MRQEQSDKIRLMNEMEQLKKENEILKDRLNKTQSLAKIGDWYNNVIEKYEYWSDEIYRIIGYEPGEIEPNVDLFETFIHPEDRTFVSDMNRKATKEGESYEIEFRIRDRNHQIKWMHTKGKVHFNESGEMEKAYGLMQDITDFKAIEKELLKAKEEAEEANREKSLFLANMSHEIRVPMNGILGMVNLLLRTKLSPEQLELTSYIKHSSDSLLMIINDILDFSKIEAGKMMIEYSVFDLEATVKNVMVPYRLRTENKPVSLQYDIDPQVPQFIKFDFLRIQQILRNLIGNAVKFTKKGYVKLSITLEERKQYSDVLKFEVKDTGIGIPKEKQDKIFNEFIQADREIEQQFGGTGLGLTITKQLVELMNGTLALESAPNEGSVFTFVLEIPNMDDDEISLKRSLTEKSQELSLDQSLKILLAEDNYINQHYLKVLLEEEYRCIIQTVDNGLEALERLRDEAFDCVLMDGYMPVMNGIDATREFRHYEKTCGIGKHAPDYTPIIALTAEAIKGDEDKYMRAGADFYMTKPVDEMKLIRILNAIERNPRISHWEREAQILNQSESMKMKFMDVEKFLDSTQTMGKEDIINLLNYAIADYPKRIQIAHKALENKELEGFTKTLHYIVGSMGYFHVDFMTEMLHRFEEQAHQEDHASLIMDFNDFSMIFRQFILELEQMKRILSRR